VCTRYYGGTKLGTGGLARAYGGGVKLAMSELKLKLKIDYVGINLQMDYSQVKDFEHLLKNFESENLTIHYNQTVDVNLDIAKDDLKNFTDSVDNTFKGQVSWNIMQP
jgi:putative IMPACT (imprinted ancient) family translation regulator